MDKKKLFGEIDQIDIASILSALISIGSYESEQGIVEYIIKRLEKLPVKYEIHEVTPINHNLIASIGNEGKSLIFNTHTDTVPPGDTNTWKYHPLEPKIEDEKIFGLGSCDAKSSLASMLVAFEIIARYSSILNGKLIFQAVCCEESRARGTLAEVERGVQADAAIVGEPTELMPKIGHKGGLGLEITTFGKSAHGSSPDEGINAIIDMMHIICELENLSANISKRHNSLLGNPSLAVTTIAGGKAPNVIPDKCMITVDRRLIPGETIKNALDEINAIINKQKELFPRQYVTVKELIGLEPCIISTEEPIVKTVLNSIQEVTGTSVEPSGFTACCDMWCLVQKANIPTVILGPGKLSMAHKANEYVSIKELYQAAKLYMCVALNWLTVT